MQFSEDLQARQQARDLLQEAEDAEKILKTFSQSQLDGICEAMTRAFSC